MTNYLISKLQLPYTGVISAIVYYLGINETKLKIPSEITPPLKETYYAEIAELMKKHTGAAHVMIFHHQVRNQEKANGTGQNLNTSVQGYANGIHR